MIWALIITGYVIVAAGTAVVLEYRERLECRLAEEEHDWDDTAPTSIGLGLVWPITLLILAGYGVLAVADRLIDDAVQAEVEDRAREEPTDG